MGWSSWNCFGGDINEAKIKEIADAMISSGMKDAGYEYINIDDMWMANPARDNNGALGQINQISGRYLKQLPITSMKGD